jgi:hypothetical protein
MARTAYPLKINRVVIQNVLVNVVDLEGCHARKHSSRSPAITRRTPATSKLTSNGLTLDTTFLSGSTPVRTAHSFKSSPSPLPSCRAWVLRVSWHLSSPHLRPTLHRTSDSDRVSTDGCSGAGRDAENWDRPRFQGHQTLLHQRTDRTHRHLWIQEWGQTHHAHYESGVASISSWWSVNHEYHLLNWLKGSVPSGEIPSPAANNTVTVLCCLLEAYGRTACFARRC